MTDGIIQQAFNKERNRIKSVSCEGYSYRDVNEILKLFEQELIEKIKQNRVEFSINNILLLIGDNQE